MKNIFKTLPVALVAACTLGLTGCSDDDCPDYWGNYYGPYHPYNPADYPAYIWVDAAANFPYVANSLDGIKSYVAQAKDAGFTDLLIDVRPTNGDVLFKTALVDQVQELWTWKREGNTSVYQATQRTASWDYLQAWIDEGHAQGVRIHAAMNTMVGGQKTSSGSTSGMVYRDLSKKDWVTSIMVPNTELLPGFFLNDGGIHNMMDAPSFTSGEVFLNPHNPEVQDFIVGLVGDLASNYPDLDGIILDRGRFLDCRSDFSDLARSQFEEYIGAELEHWPDDVFPMYATTVPTSNFPTYYKEWWEFRAKAMYEIVTRSAEKAHAMNPNIQFGCYVGAWYGSYYQNGVNWASPQYDPRLESKTAEVWCSGNYVQYGYADKIDLLILGCYTSPKSIYGDVDWTAQGFATNGYKRVKGATKVIGGPDFGNWPSENYNYVDAENPDMTKDDYMKAAYNVVDACLHPLDGFFLFDIIHLQNSPQYWTPVKKALHGEPFSDDANTADDAETPAA